MGVYYELFLEGLADGRWVCLDSFMAAPDGRMAHLSAAGGHSNVRALLDGVTLSPVGLGSLSAEVRELFAGSEAGCWSFDAEEARVPLDRFEYERYVLREAMNAFENGEADGIEHWLTEAEHAALDEEERASYTFFRWDDPWGTFALKRRITAKVEDAVCHYNELVGPPGSRILKTRVVVKAS